MSHNAISIQPVFCNMNSHASPERTEQPQRAQDGPRPFCITSAFLWVPWPCGQVIYSCPILLLNLRIQIFFFFQNYFYYQICVKNIKITHICFSIKIF